VTLRTVLRTNGGELAVRIALQNYLNPDDKSIWMTQTRDETFLSTSYCHFAYINVLVLDGETFFFIFFFKKQILGGGGGGAGFLEIFSGGCGTDVRLQELAGNVWI